VRLLLTAAIAEAHGQAICQAICQACPEQITLVVAPATAAQAAAAPVGPFDAAFWSTDLMGAGNKGQPPERLQVFMDLLDAGTELQWVHTCASGSDRPVLQRLMRRGVTVTTSTGANAMAVAHSAVAGLLALARDVPHWIESRQARRWAPLRGHTLLADLTQQRAYIVGTGQVGSAIGRALRALGLSTVGVRRHSAPHADFDEVLALAELRQAAANADWLVLACPLTPATRGLVDAALLANLKPGAGLVNVARGEVVDEAALFAALDSGRLGGVYSDVAVDEPPAADSPWWTAPRVLLSAHSGGLSTGFAPRTVAMFMENLGRQTRGQALLRVATPSPDS
jgi:phosphoglycerate dehydrogenase-like enzyme